MAEFGIHFGALADPIGQQLHDQGIYAPPLDALEHLQKDADAIVRLSVRGLLPDGQARAARQKLMRKLRAAIEAAPTPQEERAEGGGEHAS